MKAPIPLGLSERADEEGLSLRVVHATAFARCLADWRKEPQLTLEVSGDGPIELTVMAGQSFVETAKDLEARLTAGLSLAVTADGLAHEATAETLMWEGDPLIAQAQLRLLGRLAADAEAWHGLLPESLSPEQVSMRLRVNATAAPVDTALLHQLFWDSAARTPQKIALIDQTRAVTYQQLRHGAANLAEILARHGAERGKLVAVIMNKGWEQAAAVLGILASGAAYVPIAPDLPEERMLHLLRHAQASVIVTQPGLAGSLPRTPGVWRVVVDDKLLYSNTFEPEWQQPTDLAYVIYTSGSTGLPKGVMIDHRGAVNTILDINRRFGVGPSDRSFALSSLGFDLSVYDIFGLLAAGGTVVFPAPGTQRAPWEWVTALDEHEVTVWNSVPALMDMLVTYAEGRRVRLPESLRLVLMSGDWIPVPLPDRIQQVSKRDDIVQIGMGGATEASIWSNFYPIGRVDPAWPSIPYGTPLTNQFFEVLDAGLRRRPDGVPGELYIGGIGVAMGYWRDEDKTRRSFITHPTTGQRLYRTGDLGRYLPDGNLEFLGREDFQVKVHGYRVELGEIEATLLGYPGVTGAVVIATEGARRLVALVTPSSVPTAGVLEHLRAKLPDYMVPDRVVPMDAFPLTANGKVDRPTLARGQV